MLSFFQIPVIYPKMSLIIYLGKLEYFTNLNLAAIWGWLPLLTMIPSEGEQWGRDQIYPDIIIINHK